MLYNSFAVSSRLPLPATPCRWQRLWANAVRPYLPMHHCSTLCQKASSVPPPPLRGTSPERGRLIYGSIRESTLPQLFIIHQRSGFIIQYSFVPPYHPVHLSRQHRADGNVCGRLIASPTCSLDLREHITASRALCFQLSMQSSIYYHSLQYM